MAPHFRIEKSLGGRVAGLDEVGRGPLAGPVVAAAVVFPRGLPRGLGKLLDDSKRLTAEKRLAASGEEDSNWSMASSSDSLMSIDEAAATLGMSRSYLYRNADKFSFVRREGRALRFSARGVQEYLSGRRRR